MIHKTFGRLVALVVLGAAVTSGCSSTLRDAATVKYTEKESETTVNIRRKDFEQQVEDLSQSKQIMASVEQNGVTASQEGTADAALSALWLTTLLNSVAVDAEFTARDLEVTDAQREQVAANYASLDDLPKYLVDTLIDQQARAAAVAADAGKDIPDAAEPTDDQLRQLYDQNKDTLAACESGKEVSHILVADEATANQIKQELDGGASFAEIASTQSTDTGSAAQGGSLGCLGAQPFVAEFQNAADTAPLDQVVGPVKSEFGYHLILVNAWNPSFEKFRAQLAQQVASQTQQQVQAQRDQLFNDAINARIKTMDVTVDPRYGKWKLQDEQYQVVPPEAPTPRDQREPSTTTTTVAGVLGG